jgi:hypothetical protein
LIGVAAAADELVPAWLALLVALPALDELLLVLFLLELPQPAATTATINATSIGAAHFPNMLPLLRVRNCAYCTGQAR